MNKALLVICDGFGEAPPGPGNAITLAHTPNLDALRDNYPYGILQASGEAVGLTEGSMGGSEVGHFTIGSGRITPQFLLAINRSMQDGSFYEKEPLVEAFRYAKTNNKALHLVGMISDKGVHSHIDHLLALLDWAAREQLSKVYLHLIGDGRDVQERSIKRYIKQVQDKIAETGVGRIATIIGRFYSMDRDKNWKRTEKGYRLMTVGEGEVFADPMEAIDHFYSKDPELTDYYMPPILISSDGLVREGDAIIFFNYRTDRTRQLTEAFVTPDFDAFKRVVNDVHFVCMGPYSKHAPVVFDVPRIQNNLAQWFAAQKVKQLRCAETEKYAHVTFFFNSQVEHAVPGEERILVDSPKVPSYAQKPEMSAYQVADRIIENLKQAKHDVIIVNFANCDLVGHSGELEATIKAVEAIDECLGKLHKQAMESDYTMLLTGDHGNADDMLYPDGSQKPAHSMNPVILLAAHPEKQIHTVKDGGLSDVAPTLLKVMDLPIPDEMTGQVLID
jgi:2,3-bisphosphoglycerate-independent phosphoglycerate mutase